MLNPRPVPTEREDLFVERYDRLLAWSLQMTERDAELAEDLLHDLFIQFTISEPDLHKISNLEGYLYSMLRNLHLAQRRRETRNTLQQLSIVEYDSAEVGLRTVDLRDQIQAQDDLRRICLYACARKETAKLASVLILRFFHGYYPEEIVQILRSPRASVDNWLKLARSEAKACLNEDSGLEFMNRTQMPEVLPTGFARTLDVFLEELRQIIFERKREACLTDDALKQLYLTEDSGPIGCSPLAHIVSCPVCLDQVNHLLDLPLLAQRSATETLGRDTRKRGGPSGGIGGGSSLKTKLNSYRRRARDTFEHKPQELCVSVNGYTLGSQRVNSERSELNLVVDPNERVNFIEVFTEQKVRLLIMGVEELPPHGPGEHTRQVKLSDHRSLDLTLRFVSPSPTIQVVYVDPTFKDATEMAAASDSIETDPVIEKRLSVSAPPDSVGSDEAIIERPSIVCTDAQVISPRVPLSSSFVRVWLAVADWHFWLRPQTVTVVFALLLLAGFAYLGLHNRVTNPTAPELLSQALSAEATLASRTDLVLHRTFTLEERQPDGTVLSHQRVEVWHSAAKVMTARRLYDESGRLLSGEWSKDGGAGTVYRSHHASTQPRIDLRAALSAIRSVEIWQLSPSANDFISLIGDREGATSEEQNGAYLISYEPRGPESGAVGLVKATLTLSRSDLHASELTLLVRDAKSNSALREYRFTESAFDRRARDTVPPSVFEPDPELLVPVAAAVAAPSAEREAEKTPVSPAPPPAVATADLEVEVLRILNQVGADMDDQTNVGRTADGKLLVSGVVETSDRKAEILRALAPLITNPALTVRIETVAEVVSRQQQSPSSTATLSVQRVEVTKANVPVYPDLRRYLTANRDGAKDDAHVDEDVRQFAAKILNRSRLIMSEAGTLKRLVGQFSTEDLRSMSSEARAKWLGVIRAHARNCEQESKRLRAELQPIFFPGGLAGVESDQLDIKDDAGLTQAATRLFELVSSNDRVVRSAFTISQESSATAAIRSPQFWSLLKSAESLAGSIARSNSSSKE